MATKTKKTRKQQRRSRCVQRVVRAIAIDLHTAGLKEVRRREKSNDGIDGLYERGTPRLIAAMEGIAKYVCKNYRPNDSSSATAK